MTGATTRVLTLLPSCNTHVDPDQPSTSQGNGLMVVSSAGNAPEQLAFVRFDLALLPADATVTACRLQFGISGNAAKQVVDVNFVADNTWTEQLTYADKPAASAPIGTWLVEAPGSVSTTADNPALVQQVIAQRAASGAAISMQLSSTFGAEGAQVSNAYQTFETAKASNDPASAPRLVIEYQPRPIGSTTG